MYAGYLVPTPANELPYQVIVRRRDEIVRIQPVASIAEGNRALTELLQCERKYERELRWYESTVVELDA